MKKCIALLLCLVLLGSMGTVCALSIDPDRDASLTLIYHRDEEFYAGLEIRIFRVAQVGDDFALRLVAPFKSYPVEISHVRSQQEWKTIAETLAGFALADKISPSATAVTDEQGCVVFSGLRPGMYLTLAVRHATAEKVVTFENFLTVIPGKNQDGNANYDVTAYPKCGVYTPEPPGPGEDPGEPEKVAYKVVKQWKDAGATQKRSAVTVEIYKDGALQETVTLSQANQWTHSWTVPLDSAVWSVVERDVPRDYFVNVTRKDTTFLLTNVFDGHQEPPKTGNTGHFGLYLLLMLLSGMALLTVSLGGKRRQA